ncbi:MAG: hypothetical protein KF886_07235 [Candidatus Hydrogenedentes bacterium]|nr:hypothetical protein [Candidatus Hydrogenedentota bacterium]
MRTEGKLNHQPQEAIVGSLRGQQRALYEAFTDRDRRLARIYLGSLQILDSENCNRLALAAHGIRELLTELPQHFKVDLKAYKQNLGSKVRELEDAWATVSSKSNCIESCKWSGEIDGPLSKFLTQMHTFIDWVRVHMPRRKDEAAETLFALDPARGRLPKDIERIHVDLWFKLRDYFVGIAHHGGDPSWDEFSQYLDELERFLLDRLSPRTFSDMDEIDSLIAHGESND